MGYVIGAYFLCIKSSRKNVKEPNCFLFFLSGSCLPNGTLSVGKSKFDDKIEASSAKMYFHYYGQLLHQQNMLQDYVRTGYVTKL